MLNVFNSIKQLQATIRKANHDDNFSPFKLDDLYSEESRLTKELQYRVRKAICNDNLEGGYAEHINDIKFWFTGRSAVRIEYKGLLLGFYEMTESALGEIRPMIEDFLKEDWFNEELKTISSALTIAELNNLIAAKEQELLDLKKELTAKQEAEKGSTYRKVV